MGLTPIKVKAQTVPASGVSQVFIPQSMSEQLEVLDFRYYSEDAIKKALKVNDHFVLTEKTVEKILDAYPAFFNDEDVYIGDSNSCNTHETELLLKKDPPRYQIKFDYSDDAFAKFVESIKEGYNEIKTDLAGGKLNL